MKRLTVKRVRSGLWLACTDWEHAKIERRSYGRLKGYALITSRGLLYGPYPKLSTAIWHARRII